MKKPKPPIRPIWEANAERAFRAEVLRFRRSQSLKKQTGPTLSNYDNPGKIYVPGLKPEDFLEDHELAEMTKCSPPSRCFPNLQGMGKGFAFPQRIAESLHNYALDAAMLFQLDKTVFPPEFSKHVQTMDVDSSTKWFSRLYQHCLQIMRDGFVVALVRYQQELRENAEAAAMLAAARANSKKGAAARRKQAAPNHRKIQKLFRELRKTSPKKTVRYLRVAKEFKMSDRQIARIVDGID